MKTARHALRCTILLAALAAPAPRAEATAAPPAPIPDTPAGRRFADLMRLADGADQAVIEAYVRDNFGASMQARSANDPGIVPFLVDHARQFHGFDVERVLASKDDHVMMLVRPRSQANRWLRYILTVESAAPYRVAGLFLMPAGPEDIPRQDEAALDPEAAVAAFAKDVERAVTEEGFSGVVLLARGGDVVLQRATGLADRDHRVPVGPETVFSLASMNKMFTAVAIGRLVDQGRVAWSDPVGKHLEGWLPPEHEASITIQQLLTHTAGLGDYLGQIESDPAIREAASLAAYRELVRKSPVEPPENGMQYSNSGYVVLGALIEAVTGRDYFDVVRETVYAPAGMTRTDSWRRDDVVADRATGYIPPDESVATGLGPGWHSNARLHGLRGTSAGGGYATAGDMLRFARALVEGRLVTRETLDALLAPRVRFPVGGHYAYGFIVHQGRDGKRIFGHAGGFPGASGELKVYGDGAWTLVVLSNVSGGAGRIVGAWDGIAARLAP